MVIEEYRCAHRPPRDVGFGPHDVATYRFSNAAQLLDMARCVRGARAQPPRSLATERDSEARPRIDREQKGTGATDDNTCNKGSIDELGRKGAASGSMTNQLGTAHRNNQFTTLR